MSFKLTPIRHHELAEAGAAIVQQAGPVPSPCVSRCRIDATTGWCEGCLRTIDEITAWSTMPYAGKRAVWQRVLSRLDSVPSGA